MGGYSSSSNSPFFQVKEANERFLEEAITSHLGSGDDGSSSSTTLTVPGQVHAHVQYESKNVNKSTAVVKVVLLLYLYLKVLFEVPEVPTE